MDDCFKNEIYQDLQNEDYYVEMLTDLGNRKTKEILRKNGKYWKTNKMLVVHLDRQLEYVQYWQIVSPDSLEIQNKILNEYHAIPVVPIQATKSLI